MAMDVENFIEQDGRAELVKEVRAKIDALGIEYLYLQFVSITGKIMGKGIPSDHWETVAQKGFQLVYGATMNLFTNRAGDYLGYGPEAAELIGIPFNTKNDLLKLINKCETDYAKTGESKVYRQIR